MKPHRIRMTHNLLLNYGLYRKMEIYVSVMRRKALGYLSVAVLVLQAPKFSVNKAKRKVKRIKWLC